MPKVILCLRKSWPIALAFIWPFALILVWSGPFDLTFWLAPLILFLWFASAISCFMFALSLMIENTWRQAFMTLFLPFLSFLAFINIQFVSNFVIDAGEYTHVYVMRSSYLREIATMPVGQGPKLAVFQWGGFAGIGHAAVYDESDEIASVNPSDAWRNRASKTLLDCGVLGGRPVGGHFYIVTIGC